MNFILGKKMRMTQIWEGDKVIPVTPVKTGPCFVVQIKNKDTDGYSALQIGFGDRKEKNIKKPQKNHIAKAGVKSLRYLKEFRTDILPEAKIGDVIALETFAKGEIVDAIGVSKGKGFAGVVKRHGFHGFRKTHGNKDQERASGSIGPKGPAHVFKGTRMGGHMGDENTTTKNLTIANIDSANNIIYIKGALPGATDSLIALRGKGELKLSANKAEEVKEEVLEEAVVEETPVVVEEVAVAAEETPAEVVETVETAEETKEEIKNEEVK